MPDPTSIGTKGGEEREQKMSKKIGWFKRALLASLFWAWFLPDSALAGEYVLLGDGGYWLPHTRTVRDSLLRAGLRKLVMPGDNLYVPLQRYEDVWSPWSSHGFEFTAVAIGNHHGGIEQEVRFFGMPGEYYSKLLEPGVRLLVLNSERQETAPEQARWLDSELEKATESFVFVMYHHPSLSVTPDHGWEERRRFQLQVRPLLFKHRAKITAVLNGHDHVAAAYSFNDLPVIVGGASMQARKPVARRDTQEGISVRTLWLFEEAPYWVAFEPNVESGLVTFRFVRATDDAESCRLTIRTGEAPRLAGKCGRTGTPLLPVSLDSGSLGAQATP